MSGSAADSVRERLLARRLGKARRGRLVLRAPDGREEAYGGDGDGPRARMEMGDWRLVDQITRAGDVGLAQAYIDGWWDSPEPEGLYRWIIANLDDLDSTGGSLLFRLAGILRNRIWRRNSLRISKRNIIAHYDLGNEFFSLFLDPSMTYSSALFEGEERTLQQAQLAKYDRLLGFQQGAERLLEIGCGWGGLAERAAEGGRRVTGLTLSPSQRDFAAKRLGGRADILLRDYREEEGVYDGIVSIEMFEAVGERYWPAWMRCLHDRLRPGGVAAIQYITIADDAFEAYRKGTDFIRTHIFPGGMLITRDLFVEHAAKAGLELADERRFAEDYAATLRLWLKAFDANLDRVRGLGFDERFVRTWRLYLSVCAAGFASGRTDVIQMAMRRG